MFLAYVGGSLRRLGIASNRETCRRSSCSGFKVSIANTVFLAQRNGSIRDLGAASDRRTFRRSSCPGPKVSIQIAVFLALLRLGHAGLMHGFMRMRSLPRAQGLHPNCGVFGPIVVGACGAHACLHADEEPAQGPGSASKLRCFWPYCGGSMRGSCMASCG